MDFGFSNDQAINTNDSVSENNGGNDKVTDIDTGDIIDDNSNNSSNIDDNSNNGGKNTTNPEDVEIVEDDNSQREPLQEGTQIEVNGETYTVDASGNIRDKNGNVFKEATEVNSWLDSFDNVEDAELGEGVSIQAIQDAIGVELTDENNIPIDFENSVDGIKSYVNAVIEASREEHYNTAINTLYQRYPILEDVLNYYVANGNSLEGFNQIPNRSEIVIDDNNEIQHEAIIRQAWKERNQKGDLEGYLGYLKASGTLLATAREELDYLQQSDNEYRQRLAAEAEAREAERMQVLENYWSGVHDVIKTRRIAGYQIPESIVANRNGQRLSLTPEDFFNYIYRVDNEGKSAYERDLEQETPESRRDDEILRAYLKFVGGTYSNLVDMAINDQKVNTLKLKAKERRNSTVKISKPNATPAKGTNIDLDYK